MPPQHTPPTYTKESNTLQVPLSTLFLAGNAAFIEGAASERNTTHSATIAGKLINISLPAILWSFDTISVLAFFVLR